MHSSFLQTELEQKIWWNTAIRFGLRISQKCHGKTIWPRRFVTIEILNGFKYLCLLKRSLNQLALSLDIVGNSNTFGKCQSTCCSEYKSMKNWVIQFTIKFLLEDKLPLTRRFLIPLFLLLELAILWKNLVLESPSLNCSTLGFCLPTNLF